MNTIQIGNKIIGQGQPCFIIAEMSANHNNDFATAKRLVEIAKECGADAIKLQTYTADTITLKCDNEYFRILDGPWKNQTLYELYKKAHTPWSWQKELKTFADQIGIICFSSPFDSTSVDFLETLEVLLYKIASFEIVDIPLIKYVAKMNKPIILSTGMASLADIELAVKTIQNTGNNKIALLKCTSDYPANPSAMNLITIEAMQNVFGIPIGLSDHSMTSDSAIAAVALGARIIEKHIIENRSAGGPDAHFSMEPAEFEKMIQSIRNVEQALGKVTFGPTENEISNIVFRKSIFISKNISKGELFSSENIRVVRPGHGLHPKYYEEIIGKEANQNIPFGTPLSWHHVSG